MTVLAIERLGVVYPSERGDCNAVRDVSLTVRSSECVGVVGESGSGKTQVFMAVMGLLPPSARVSGNVRFEEHEILGAAPALLNRFRGSKLSMIFQDPMSALTPHLTIGLQMAEGLVCHGGLTWHAAQRAALGVLERVQVPDAARRLRQYPHELSGGIRQRVMIGMSLLGEPSLLIADEPTTALDVSAQAQIVGILRALRASSKLSIVLVSHDLGLVAQLADRIVVMYAGRVVESAASADLLTQPRHPYTGELLRCMPDLRGPRLARMPSLTGHAPSPSSVERGCAFAPRCPRVGARCADERPPLRVLADMRQVACHYA